MSKIFIDIEYNSKLQIISIGLISEDNTSFYAEICDTEVDNKEVEDKLIFKDICGNYKSEIISYRKSLQIKGTLITTLEYLKEWLSQFQSPILICKKKEFKNLNSILSFLNVSIIPGKFKKTKILYNAIDIAKDLKNKFYE